MSIKLANKNNEEKNKLKHKVQDIYKCCGSGKNMKTINLNTKAT